MPLLRNPEYWLQKKTYRKTGYPVASVAYYGPDDKFASKVVVGITLGEKAEGVAFIEKWFSTGADARRDRAITEQVLEFIEKYDVERVAMVDRIIGCPHEVGIDYPEGQSCPQCPFWANRDRWTGQLLS